MLALGTAPGPLYTDLFGRAVVPATYAGIPIHVITPAHDPQAAGVEFTGGTADGLRAVYAQGEAAGRAFLRAQGWAA